MSNQPRNDAALLATVTADPRYLANIDWGEPRSGHPEGSIRAHIAELEQNLNLLSNRLNADEIGKLMLLIHVHDTFKKDADPGAPIRDARNHASLARTFLAKHCSDTDLLAMVQLHDEPFALFRQFKIKGTCSADRFRTLLNAIADWSLFSAFLIIDGCTKGKSREPLRWFFAQIEGKVDTRFMACDILPCKLGPTAD